MTGFLIGVGAAGLENFRNCVVLEFSSTSAFTAVFYVKSPVGVTSTPIVVGGSAEVTRIETRTYRMKVGLPAGYSVVYVFPVRSLRFNSDQSYQVATHDSVRKLVRIFSVGNAYTESVTDGGFRGANNLVEVKLPNCTGVGKYTFLGCSALKKFVGGSLDVVGEAGFYRCTSLTDFTATRTAGIRKGAWDGCSALTDLSLPGCSFSSSDEDCLGTLSALQYLRFPDKTLAQVQAMSGYGVSISRRTGVTLVCSDGTQVIT